MAGAAAPVRQVVEGEMGALPLVPLDELYEGSPRVSDAMMSAVFEAADALLRQRDSLVWSKMQGLQALDDYNDIHVAHGDLMFLLGVEYGRRLAAADSLK